MVGSYVFGNPGPFQPLSYRLIAAAPPPCHSDSANQA